MAQREGLLREVRWSELLPWLLIVKAVRLTLSPKTLILATIGLLGMYAGFHIIGDLFSGADDQMVKNSIERFEGWPWQEYGLEGKFSQLSIDSAVSRNPLSGVFPQLTHPFVSLFSWDLSTTGLAYYLLCCLWSSLVWALAGGAITRIAALSFTRDEPMGLFASLAHAARRWPSYFAIPLIPLLGVLFLLVIFGVCGWTLTWGGFFVFLGGLLWFIALLAGLFLAIVMLALLVGWPLMWPAVSTEGTDAFDALSRGFAYVYQRPFYYLFLILFAGLVGAISYLVLGVFVDKTVYLGDWLISWGAGRDRMAELAAMPTSDDASWLGGSGATMRLFWINLATLAKPAFQVGFFWTAATALYLLLRRAVDATDLDDITLDAAEETHSVPPFTEQNSEANNGSNPAE